MSFKRLDFSKDWTRHEDFPTVQTDESQIREDLPTPWARKNPTQIQYPYTRQRTHQLFPLSYTGDT